MLCDDVVPPWGMGTGWPAVVTGSGREGAYACSGSGNLFSRPVKPVDLTFHLVILLSCAAPFEPFDRPESEGEMPMSSGFSIEIGIKEGWGLSMVFSNGDLGRDSGADGGREGSDKLEWSGIWCMCCAPFSWSVSFKFRVEGR